MAFFLLAGCPDLKRKRGQGWVGRVWLRIRFDQLRVLLGGCRVRVKVVMALG